MTERSRAVPIGERLLVRVEGFLERLRAEGIPTGPSGGVDLGRALGVLPVLDRFSVRTACVSTLAKSPADVEEVGRVFDDYWTSDLPARIGRPVRAPQARAAREPRRALGPPPVPGPAPEEAERARREGRYSRRAPVGAHPMMARSPEEMRRLRHACRRFRRSIATRPGRRWQRATDGSVDLRRTARRGLRTGGEWVELSRRDRAPRRADLVLLWDVSGSMREHSSTLFALVYALCRTVPRSRVFAFGHEIAEVSGLCRGWPYPRALPELTRQLARTGGGTQIAHCLAEFRRRWGSSVRPTSTVAILSDGWDLGSAPELAGELERLGRIAHGIVWVNPYASEAGFSPDTLALRAALPYLERLTSPVGFPAPFHGGRTRPDGATHAGEPAGTHRPSDPGRAGPD